MHVVVVGCGRVGSELADLLEQAATPSRSSTSARTRSDDSRRASRPSRSSASASTATRCIEAGIDQADALAAVTSGDNSNIMSARVARETFAIERVVARIYDPRRAVIYQRLGIPTVATVSWTTDQVMRRLLPEPSMRADWVDASGTRRRSSSATLPPRWAGPQARRPRGARASSPRSAAVDPTRDRSHLRRRARRPGGRHPPLHGRTPTRSMRSTKRLAGPPTHHRGPLMRVAIAGAGNVGMFIANELVGQRPRGAAHRADAGRRREGPRRERASPTSASPTRARCRR